MRAHVVIGAGFGDEGKGLVTDRLVRELGGSSVTVIRFNGGAQAGHTVVTPEGVRHEFHHFGSGTLQDAKTYLSRFFIVNPMAFVEELTQLEALGPHPRVYVDPRALLTTPYDMLINREVERRRGARRHGSCGFGVNETMVRGLTDFRTTVATAFGGGMRYMLRSIRARWADHRLEQLGLAPPHSPEFTELFHSKELLDRYEEDLETFKRNVQQNTLIPGAGPYVFEGAQGLLLDQDHRFFPHVTHSKTGLPNVSRMLAENRIGALDVYYVTRAYMTRHGAGPFPTEDPSLSYPDTTNKPNEDQGELRFGRFDVPLIQQAVHDDLRRAEVPLTAVMAVTCLDQVDSPELAIQHAKLVLPVGFTSHGPTRNDVRRILCDSKIVLDPPVARA